MPCVWIPSKEGAGEVFLVFSQPGSALPTAQPWLGQPCGQLVAPLSPLPRAAKVGSLMATLHNSAPLLLSLFLPDTQSLLFIWITFLCYGIWVVFPSLPTPAADS